MKPQEDGRFKSRTFSRSLEKELVLSSEGIGDKRSIGVETQTGGKGTLSPIPKSHSHLCRAEKVIVSSGRNA